MGFSSRPIGGRRAMGTNYVVCAVCGVQFKLDTEHPDRDYVEMVNGWPVNTKCPHIGKVVPKWYEISGNRADYEWVRNVVEWR